MAIALLTLVLLGTACLLATTVLGYVAPHSAAWMRQHFLWSLGSTFLLVMGHSRVFPVMTSALLLAVVNFMMGAAAHTHAVPRWVHEALAWATILTCLLALYREYRALGDNNRLIGEAASRREDTAAP